MTAASVTLRGVSRSYGALEVLRGVDLDVAAGEMLVLLGPSGCGKSTLLRQIAGLDAPDAGEVLIDGSVVSSRTRRVPAEHRNLGMVFQDGALFPHLNVARNVGFGLPRSDRRRSVRIDEMLELVGLTGLGDRMPESLSGGQRQRVALARALAPSPGVLLMDEPFSNLDAVLRAHLRREVRALLSSMGVTTIFVTHDREEAFAIADSVAVMRDGVIAQHDTPRNVYARPASRWLASFVGEARFMPGTVVGNNTADTALGRSGYRMLEPGVEVEVGDAVDLLVRPEDLVVRRTPAPGVATGAEGATAVVENVEFSGGSVTLSVKVGDRQLLVSGTPHHLGDLDEGDSVVVAWATGDGDDRDPGRSAYLTNATDVDASLPELG